MPEAEHNFANVAIKIILLVRKEKIDIVHSHRYKENLLALILAKILRVKCLISTMHGMPELHHNHKKNSEKLSLISKLNHFILDKYFNYTVAVSKDIKNQLIRKFNFDHTKVKVIYNGIPAVSEQKIDKIASKSIFHVGTVGRMVPVKNFELFIKVAAAVKKANKNIHFSILGDGPLKESLIEKTKKLNVNDIVELVPATENPLSYYRSLDVYMNTSIHEGIPLSVLEAMICCTPVIAPKVGGIPEIVENENGILIEGHDPEKYAKSCINLIKDSYKREDLGKRSRERIFSEFLASKMAEAYVQIYQDCT
jgi:glycosyltransferase involved in cell wall biosynthesis